MAGSGDELVYRLCYNVDGCDKDATSTCSRCRCMRYCSAECQRAHWSVHRVYCDATVETAKRHGTLKVNRLVSVPDRQYASFLATLKAEGKARIELKDRKEEVTRVVIRRDGHLYEAPSGIPIQPLSVAMEKARKDHEEGKDAGKACTTEYRTNWGELMSRCGNVSGSEYGHACFYDAPSRRVYVLHKASDQIVKVYEHIETFSSPWFLLDGGRVVLTWTGTRPTN
jgi:hypothetical protein